MREELRVELELAIGGFKRAVTDAKKSLGQLESATEDVKDANDEVSESAQDLAEETKKSTKKQSDSWDSLKKFLVRLGIGLVIKKMAEGFVGLITGAADTAKEIQVMSGRIGISTDEFQKWNYIAGIAGTNMDTLQGGMTDLAEKMHDASLGTGEASEIFSILGIEVANADGTMKDVGATLEETMRALMDLEDPTLRQALATKLFSTTGEELLPVLNGQYGSMDDLIGKFEEYGIVLDQEAIAKGVKFNDDVTVLKGTLSGLKTEIGLALMPVLQDWADYIKDNLPEIKKKFAEVRDYIADKLVPKIVDLWDNIQDNIPGIIEGFKDFAGKVKELWGQVEKLLPYVDEAIIAFGILKGTSAVAGAISKFKDLTTMLTGSGGTIATTKNLTTALAGPGAAGTGGLAKAFSLFLGPAGFFALFIAGGVAVAKAQETAETEFHTYSQNMVGGVKGMADAYLEKEKWLQSESLTGWSGHYDALAKQHDENQDELSRKAKREKVRASREAADIRAGIRTEVEGIKTDTERMRWAIPIPAIPKFQIQGSFNFQAGTTPRIVPSYYAAGGVFDSPHMFGFGGGLGVLGEAGAEAVVPLENNLGWLDKLAGMLDERMGSNKGPTNLVLELNGTKLGEVVLDSINSITRQTGRLDLLMP